MKKAFLIFFVLVAAVGACFATTDDYLKLTTTILGEKPEFTMEGNTVLGTQTGAQVKVGSPVDGNVEVAMVVKQSNDARYKGTFNISVTATALSNTDTTTYPGQATSAPTVSTLLSQVTNGTDFAVTTSENANVVTLAMDYKTGSKVAKCDVATWKFVWAQAPSLAQGTYEGTVTLSYTAP